MILKQLSQIIQLTSLIQILTVERPRMFSGSRRQKKCGRRRDQRASKHEKKPSMRKHHCTLKMRGNIMRNAGSLKRLRGTSSWQLARKGQSHPCSYQEPSSPTTWMNLEVNLPQELPDERSGQLTPWFWPCDIQSKGTSWAPQASDIENCEVANVCFFKLLIWAYLLQQC